MKDRKRIAIWLSMSKLYLDTDLNKFEFDEIIKTFKSSNYKYAKLKSIDIYELSPFLWRNQDSMAGGEWEGFDESWVIKNCEFNYSKRNSLTHKLKCWFIYVTTFFWRIDYWIKIKREFKN